MACTNGISGAIQKKYGTFQAAIKVYTRNYNHGAVHAVPIPSGPFWPANLVNHLPSALSSASTSTNSDDLWVELDDLSHEFSQVMFA